jgi:hypothetical protein
MLNARRNNWWTRNWWVPVIWLPVAVSLSNGTFFNKDFGDAYRRFQDVANIVSFLIPISVLVTVGVVRAYSRRNAKQATQS